MATLFACGGPSSPQPSQPNAAPSARIGLDPSSPTIGEKVLVDASASKDPDGDTLQYLIRVEGPSGDEVARVDSSEGSLRFRADRKGTYLITATVTDEAGASSRTSRSLEPSNRAPIISASWVLANDGKESASGSGDQGVRAFGEFDRISVRIDDVRDPDGHEVDNVSWVVESSAEPEYEERNPTRLKARLPEQVVYDIRAVVEDEYGKKGELEFYVSPGINN